MLLAHAYSFSKTARITGLSFHITICKSMILPTNQTFCLDNCTNSKEGHLKKDEEKEDV